MTENVGTLYGGKLKSKGLPWSKRLFLVVMLALPVANWLVFWLFVNVNTIVLAFQDMRTGLWTLQNFVVFFDRLTGGDIGLAVKNTFLYFGLNLIVLLPGALFISFFIYKKILFYKGFRILFYLPAIISGVAMVAAFTNFIDPKGPLGAIVRFFGGTIPPEGLLGRKSTATLTILVYCTWTGFCGNVLLFGGAMTRIPTEILESAKLEGCGPFREIRSIILPLIWPTFSTMIILAFTGIFTSSGPILLFDPTNTQNTQTLAFWIFRQVYGDGAAGGSGSYNLVSATGLCFTLVGVPIILFTRWLVEKVPAVEY